MNKHPRGRQWRKAPRKVPKGKQAVKGQSVATGRLKQVLRRPEYFPLGDEEIFEGTFLQLTKRGEYAVIHNQPNLVTIGILASSPSLLLPDIMVIARVRKGVRDIEAKPKDLEVTRLISLNLVAFQVHSMNERQLRVKMANGRKYYLQLCAPEGQEDFLFHRWLRLIYLLNMATGRISDPISFTSKQSGLHTIWKSTSFRATPEKHWLAIVMAEGSTERMKEQLRQAKLVKSTSRSMESVPVSKRSIQKSGVAGRSSQGSHGIPAKKGHTSRAPPASSARRSPTSVAAGPVGVGAKATASNPSRLVSRLAQMSSEKLAPSAAPSKLRSRDRSSPSQPQTVKSPKPSRSQTALSPSPEQGSPPSQSPSQKEKEPSLQLHRTMESLAMGPSSQGWDNVDVGPSKVGGQTSRPQTRGLETEKQSKDLAKPIQPSSATGKPELSRSSKSKNKLEKAQSSARQKSSPTFITIYSAKSSSLERLKGKLDSKVLDSKKL